MTERPTLPQQYSRDFQARQAARMRLPIWLRLLMPVMAMSSILAVTIASIAILLTLHRALHPEISFANVSNVPFILIFFPTFFGAMAPGLMLLNFVFVQIPALKRIFDSNAEGVPDASYRDSMKGLRKVAKILFPPALVLALLGAIEPWAF